MFTYFPLGKALEKLIDALKSLKLSNKTDELKPINGIFSINLLNYFFFFYKLTGIIKL